MKKLMISIVIPAFNEESRIERCLKSISYQTVQPFEVLVVDNNSTDKTVALASQFSFVTVIHESKQGIVHARDAGFNAAKGTVIARIDADSILPEDWIAQVTEHFSKSTLPVTGPGYFYNLPFRSSVMKIVDVFGFRVSRVISGNNILWGSNMAFRKADWLAIKNSVCKRNDIHEDLDLAAHLQENGTPTEYNENLIVGVEMKTGFVKARSTWKYLLMRPKTHQAHKARGWTLSYVLAALIFSVYWVMPLGVWTINTIQRRLFALARLDR